MIVTFRSSKNLFSAVIAGGGVICHEVPRASAANSICEALIGVTLADAMKMLDTPVSAREWQASWSAAVRADLAELNDEVAALADEGRADMLTAKIAALHEMLAAVHVELIKANVISDERNRLAAERLAIHEREVKQREDAAAEQERLIAEERQRRRELRV
ncbi:hypothetical protein [Lacipirellula sp.]|uniref:hypothetical protein n=1 Tax=Lacipirellula sp. TaxID=2691419 RepID=UPI003D0965DD